MKEEEEVTITISNKGLQKIKRICLHCMLLRLEHQNKCADLCRIANHKIDHYKYLLQVSEGYLELVHFATRKGDTFAEKEKNKESVYKYLLSSDLPIVCPNQ